MSSPTTQYHNSLFLFLSWDTKIQFTLSHATSLRSISVFTSLLHLPLSKMSTHQYPQAQSYTYFWSPTCIPHVPLNSSPHYFIPPSTLSLCSSLNMLDHIHLHDVQSKCLPFKQFFQFHAMQHCNKVTQASHPQYLPFKPFLLFHAMQHCNKMMQASHPQVSHFCIWSHQVQTLLAAPMNDGEARCLI